MGQKRKHSQIVTDRMPYNRPSRSSLPEASALLEAGEDQHPDFTSAQPRIDPNCGQRGAFPGLDDGPDELFYGPANDGLDYLRMVRSEAKGVPNLLVAPKQDGAEEDQAIYDSGVGDTRGYYQNGAYVAAPTLGPIYSADESSIEEDKDPQVAYYEALAVRFESFRANLRRAPPTGAIAALDEKHPISLPWGSAEATAQWRRLLHSTNPLPAQLVAMDQQTVLGLIKLIVNGMKRGRSIEKRTSQWIWALLGKLNDAGCLGSEEVGIVRDLGKRAVWLLVGIRQKKEASDTGDADVEEELQDEDGLAMYADTAGDNPGEPLRLETKPVNQDELLYADLATKTSLNISSDDKQEYIDRDKAVEMRGAEEFEDGEINEEDQLAALKERMMARVASTSVEVGNSIGFGSGPPLHVDNTVVTIDMILTIVGELYGQRDLLEYRDLWDEEQ